MSLSPSSRIWGIWGGTGFGPGFVNVNCTIYHTVLQRTGQKSLEEVAGWWGFAFLRSHIYFYFTFELVFQESPLKAGSRLLASSLPELSADV